VLIAGLDDSQSTTLPKLRAECLDLIPAQQIDERAYSGPLKASAMMIGSPRESADLDHPDKVCWSALMAALFSFPLAPWTPPSVEGFHGTSLAAARAIVKEQRMSASANPYDWLGDGVYFWEGAQKAAWLWAERAFPGEEIGVVHARILLGVCLDMITREFDEMYRYAASILDERRRAQNEALLVNNRKNHARDRAVYNLLCEHMDRPVDCVRDVYAEGDRLSDGSPSADGSHLHLCVRNPKMIGRLELVQQGIARTLAEQGRLK